MFCDSTDNYTWYYADIDNYGDVDGVIFEDLYRCAHNYEKTVSGQWTNENGYYSYSIIESTNEYYVGQTYDGPFGSKPVVSIQNSTGKDRFYVMALEDVDDSNHYWYKNINGNLSDYESTTSTEFGKGRTNTFAMINKWNNSYYGEQNNDDIWKIIQNQSKYPIKPNRITGWFVPSKAEWNAFKDIVDIQSGYISNDGIWIEGNNKSFGINNYYWTSSQFSNSYAWRADFDGGYMGYSFVNVLNYVRLATTF